MKPAPAGGFGPKAFRTLPYLTLVVPEGAAAKAKRENDIVFDAFVYLLDFPATTWRERVRQIDFALDMAAAFGGAK